MADYQFVDWTDVEKKFKKELRYENFAKEFTNDFKFTEILFVKDPPDKYCTLQPVYSPPIKHRCLTCECLGFYSDEDGIYKCKYCKGTVIIENKQVVKYKWEDL